MPQVFKIAGYTVYFWINENDPLEPNRFMCILPKGFLLPMLLKYGSQKMANAFCANNNSKIPNKQLRVFMQIIEARSKSVFDLWYSTFKQISFYC